MSGSVAICTLASELLMNDLWEAAPRGGGITGRTLAESFGVPAILLRLSETETIFKIVVRRMSYIKSGKM